MFLSPVELSCSVHRLICFLPAHSAKSWKKEPLGQRWALRNGFGGSEGFVSGLQTVFLFHASWSYLMTTIKDTNFAIIKELTFDSN